MDLVSMTAEWMAQFTGVAVEAVEEVAAWSQARRWRWRRRGTMVKAEEKQDGSVLGHGGEGRVDSSDGMDPAAAAALSKRAASKWAWKFLAAWRRPSQNPLVRV
jgi:hypothetical protein